MAKATDVEPIPTVAALAKLVGRNKGTVSRWLANPSWTFGRPPWPRRKVPEILHWAAANLRDRSDVQAAGGAARQPVVPAPPPVAAPADGQAHDLYSLKGQKLAAEVRKLVAQANHAETALAKERGRLLDADDVEVKWARVGAAIRNGFENLASELVGYALTHGMPQTSAPAFHQQIDAAVDRVLRKLSEGDDGEAEDDEGG